MRDELLLESVVGVALRNAASACPCTLPLASALGCALAGISVHSPSSQFFPEVIVQGLHDIGYTDTLSQVGALHLTELRL